MKIPLQISFHGLEHSEALATLIRDKADGLDRYYDSVTSCRVVIEHVSRHQHQGSQYVARIDLKVPGGEIAITHQHDEHPQVAVREAFDAARRKLEDYARTQRGDVKHHQPT